MITPMSFARAVLVADRGPKTEAQRVQAVKALRRLARARFWYDPRIAKLIRKLAKGLTSARTGAGSWPDQSRPQEARGERNGSIS